MEEPPDPLLETPIISIPAHKTTTKDGRIPPDSLLQIWSHLPLPSLYKFRSVSQLWNLLISSDPLLPVLRHTLPPPPQQPPTLLLILRHSPSNPVKHPDRPAHLSTTPFHHLISSYPVPPRTHPLKNLFTPYTDTTLHLLPSHGPLTCFASHLFLYLSNPSTNQSLRLSPPNSSTSSAAFGFFCLEQRYVLVSITNSDLSAHLIEFGPGQAKSANWTRLPSPAPVPVRGFGLMVNGLFFWMIASEGYPGFVLCLNHVSCEYFIIPRPDAYPGEEMLYDQMYLVEFKGSVCAVDNFSRPPRMEVWVLHDEGDDVGEKRFYWVKKYNVFISGMWKDLVFPFCEYGDNGDEIVLCNGTRSRMYCHGLKSRTVKQVYKPKQRSFEQLALYTPGLFPLTMVN